METIFKKVSRSHENKLEVVTLSRISFVALVVFFLQLHQLAPLPPLGVAVRLVRRRDPDAALRLDLLASFVLQQKNKHVKQMSPFPFKLSLWSIGKNDSRKKTVVQNNISLLFCPLRKSNCSTLRLPRKLIFSELREMRHHSFLDCSPFCLQLMIQFLMAHNMQY